MRLHWLELQDFRGVRERRVEFAAGVTVIVGPNEAGKSSMGEALRLLLDPSLKANSTHRRVRDVRPIDRDVDPRVGAEIESGPYRFTLFRCFGTGKRGTVELKVTAPHPEQCTGDAALARLDAILAETTDIELFHALTAIQGAKVGSLALPSSGWLQQALDASATAAGHFEDDQTSSLFERAQDQYLRFFTKGTGREVSDGAKLEQNVTKAREDRDAAAAKLTELQQKVEEIERLRQQVTTAEQRLPVEEEACQERTTELAALQTLEQRCVQARANLEAARAKAARDRDAQKVRDDLVEEARLAGSAAEKARIEASRLDRLAQEQQQLHAAAEAELAKARAATASARDLQRALEADVERLDRLGRAQDLRVRAERAQRLAEQLDRARHDLTLGLDEERLRSLEEAARADEIARERVQVSAARLGVEAIAATEVELDGERRCLAAGEQVETRAGGSHEVIVPGTARIFLVGGAAQDELEAHARACAAELARAIHAAGVADLEEARRRYQLRLRAGHEVRDLSGRLDDELSGVEPGAGESAVETLLRQAREESDRAARLLDQRPAGLPEPDDRSTAQDALDRSRDAEQRAFAAESVAAASADEARRAWDAARDACGQAQGSARLAKDHAADRAARIEAARSSDGDDGAVAGRARQSDEQARASEREIAGLERDLAAAGLEEKRLLADNARQVVEQRRQEIAADRARLQELGGFLRAKEADGLGEIVRDAETALERATQARSEWTRRAAAARALFETMRRHRETTRAARVAPLTEGVTALGRIVFGPDFQVRLDDDLRIIERTLGGTTLPFDQLSVGAREQLDLLLRIAAARSVTPKGGLPLVLDDTLGNADPERLQRMNAALAHAGKELQILVLTCYPDRFRSIGNQVRIDLGIESA